MSRSEQHIWTDAEKARLAEVAPGRTHAEIRAIMTAEFGDHFGGRRVDGALKRYGIRTGLDGRFKKGCSGGFKSEEHRRRFLEAGERTRFKKGNLPHNCKEPIGYEMTDRDGYVRVKVSDGLQDGPNRNFRFKHHVVYEKHHGAIPEGHNVVFADGDRTNFDPENLVAVPRAAWCVIQKKKLPYWDAESLRTCVAIAEVDRARNAAMKRPRQCRKCGAVFEPKTAKQRTCDACLEERRNR